MENSGGAIMRKSLGSALVLFLAITSAQAENIEQKIWSLLDDSKAAYRSEERRVGKECGYRWWGGQAEDGIRDWSVTGVQTCALPIYRSTRIANAIAIVARIDGKFGRRHHEKKSRLRACSVPGDHQRASRKYRTENLVPPRRFQGRL